MALRFDVLPLVFYRPKDAFEKIKAEATIIDGLVIAFIGIIITYAILQLPVLQPKPGVSEEVTLLNPMGGIFRLNSPSIVGFLVAAATAMLGLIITGFVSSIIAKGKKNISKTIALLGYGYTLSILVAVLVLASLAVTGSGCNLSPESLVQRCKILMSPDALPGLVAAVLGLWVGGAAVAAANETGHTEGIVAYLLAMGLTVVLLFSFAIFA